MASVMDLNIINILQHLIKYNNQKHCDKHGNIMAVPRIRPIRNCTVAILDVQGDAAVSLCHERSLARWRALSFRFTSAR